MIQETELQQFSNENSSFIHPQDVPNLNEVLSSAEHKGR